MSPVPAGGPALFIGTGTAYVALVRPELDPDDPDVRLAAERAGADPGEFAGTGDVWAVLVEDGAEGDGFELPGVRDAEPAGFAERLRAGLAAASAPGGAPGPFTVDGGAVLRLEARPAGDAAYAFTARVTPPDDGVSAPRTVETGPVPTAGLLADLDAFLGSLDS
ncbi:hypothetical protein LUX12_10170 [Streptomyces somaliensis]|uniref:hypothetical protein n=1 Tax=Streptomyces somaliensis TaxID=78355 RepID=UPI0020CD3460|nr:hypothetical protein [Streptomyces somaliensis]MCP9945066.1 hypothetical protein [Streptomyces somaliensis]MCP9961718.1 hypothetical protein [Streptomyces somaliensis]MCP9974534.1 hypothetical protein [Streptomyces somaliensis]